MKQNGLFSKMIATCIIIISVCFIIAATILSFWFQDYYLNQRKDEIISKCGLISDLSIKYLYNHSSLEQLQSTVEFVSDYLKSDIWLVDKSGYVYVTSSDAQKKYIGQQILGNDITQLEENKIMIQRGTYNNIYEHPVYTVGIPVKTYDGEFVGAIIVNTSMSYITEALKNVYRIIWISAILIIVFAGVVLYWFSQKYIIKPLEEINSIAKKIAVGEVDRRVKVESNDEIGELAHNFNYMADFLEKNEKNRRRFVSDVSHEIRSPITSIKGFIGAILDGVIPQDKQNHYLTMAYEETNRLTRLVNDLLDLSSLESGKSNLKYEEIDVNELIKLTILKFERKIIEKNLVMDVVFDSDKLIIIADKDKLIQVLTNLIDNAVKYAKENGKVRVSVKSKAKKALISIYNDGESIAKDDLKHIWERFYKADRSRTVKVSTGLGLPIVREIITQFGEDIWVDNIEEGVIFNFTLKRVR